MKTEIFCMIESFISGKNRSLEFARKIEVALEEGFPNDDIIQDYVFQFACYSPIGGEFLFDENEMVRSCMYLLRYIKSNYKESPNS